MASTKQKTIQETGPLKFNQLRGINDSNIGGLKWGPSIDITPNLSDYTYEGPEKSQLAVESGGKDYFGKSRYDEESIQQSEFEDSTGINESRFNNQGTLDALGNAVVKFGGTVATTVLGTLALPYGFTKVFSEGRASAIWDNDITNTLSEIEESMEDNFKIYQSDAQQKANWWEAEYLTSAGFWGDSVIKNAGFTVGAMLTGAGMMGMMGKTLQWMGKAATLSNKSKSALALLSSFISATGEGSVEAKEGKKQFIQSQTEALDAELYKEREAIEDELAETGNVALYNQRLLDLKNKRDKGLANIEILSREAGNRILALNQAFLTASNMVQFGKGLIKGFDAAASLETSINKGIGREMITTNINRAIDNAKKKGVKGALIDGMKTTLETPFMGKTRAFLTNPLTEGFEEMTQQWISSGSQAYAKQTYKDVNDYWRDKVTDDKHIKGTAETIAAIAQGWDESYGDPKQWEQFLVGAMMGGTGVYMPNKVFKQDKTKSKWNPLRYGSIEGGVYNDVKEYNDKIKNATKRTNELQELLDSKEFQPFVQKTAKQMAEMSILNQIQERQDEKLVEGDKKGFKDEETKYFAHVIETFKRAGKIQDLKDIYSYYADINDEQIDKLIQENTIHLTAEQEKQKYTEERNKEKAELISTIQDYQEAANSARAEGDNDTADSYSIAINSLAEQVNQINEDIDKHEGKETFIGNFVDSQGNRKAEWTNEAIREKLQKNSESLLSKIDEYEKAVETVDRHTGGKLTEEQEDNLVYLYQLQGDKQKRYNELMEELKKKNLLPNKLTFAKKARIDKDKDDYITYKDAADFAKRNSIDVGLVSETEDGNFEVDMRGMDASRQGVLIAQATSTEDDLKTLNNQITEKRDSLRKENNIKALEEFGEAIGKLRDALKLHEESSEYMDTLIEYLSNPNKVDESKQNAQNEKGEQEQKDNVEAAKGQVSKFLEKLRQGKISSEETSAEKNYEDKDKKGLKEARRIFNTQRQMQQNILNNPNVDEETKNSALRLLEKGMQNPESEAEALDLNREVYNSILGEDGNIVPSERRAFEIFKKSQRDGISFQEAEQLYSSNLKQVLQQAKDDLMEQRRKAGETPQSAQTAPRNGETTGRDEIDKLPIKKDIDTVIDSYEDDKGETSYIIARKTNMKGDDFTLEFYHTTKNKNGKTVLTRGTYNINKDNIKLNKLKASRNSEKELTSADYADEDGNVKVKSIRMSKGTNYVNIDGKQAFDFTMHKKDPGGTLKGLTIDDILASPEGTYDSISPDVTPFILTENRDEKEVLDINEKSAKSQEKDTKEDTETTTKDNKRYLKSNTTQFYIHPRNKKGKGRMIPYHTILREDAANARENGKIASAEKLERRADLAEIIYKFFEYNGIFDRQNTNPPKAGKIVSGKKQEGDEIRFGFNKTLNAKLAEKGFKPVVLLYNKNGNIVGDLVSQEEDISKDYSNSGFELIYTKGIEYLNNNTETSDNIIIPNLSSHVALNLIGTPVFTKENITINEIFTEEDSDGKDKPKPFKFAIVKGTDSRKRMVITPGRTTKAGQSVEEQNANVLIPPTARIGQPFVLLETSDSRRPYFPVAILMPSYSEATIGSTMGNVIFEHLKSLKGVMQDTKKLMEWKDKIADYLTFDRTSKNNPSLYINYDNGNLIFNFKQNGVAVNNTIENVDDLSEEQLANEIQSILTDNDKLIKPLAFNFSNNLINTEGEFANTGKTYNEVMGELAKTNVAKGASRTVNDFFTMNPISEVDGKIVESKASKIKNTGTNKDSVSSAGRHQIENGYYIENESGQIIVTDSNYNPIERTDENAAKLAYTWCRAKGFDSGKHLTPYGTSAFDMTTRRFSRRYSNNPDVNQALSDIYDSQENVLTDMTDSEHYIVKINGEETEHDRVHKAIEDLVNSRQWELHKNKSEAAKMQASIDNINSQADKLKSLKSIDEISKSNEFKVLSAYIDNAFGKDTTAKIVADAVNISKHKSGKHSLVEDVVNAIRTKATDARTGMHSYRALRAGQAFDEQARYFFKNGKVNYKDTTVFSKEILEKMEKEFQAFKDAHPNWTFLTDNLVVFGELHGKKIAGEVDMIAVDPIGGIHIFDFKTSSSPMLDEHGNKTKTFSDIISSRQNWSTEVQYTQQLSSYGNIIESNNPNVKIQSIQIFPNIFTYDNNGEGDNVVDSYMQPLIPLEYNKDVYSQKEFPKTFNKEETVLNDKSKTPTHEPSKAEPTIPNKQTSSAEINIQSILPTTITVSNNQNSVTYNRDIDKARGEVVYFNGSKVTESFTGVSSGGGQLMPGTKEILLEGIKKGEAINLALRLDQIIINTKGEITIVGLGNVIKGETALKILKIASPELAKSISKIPSKKDTKTPSAPVETKDDTDYSKATIASLKAELAEKLKPLLPLRTVATKISALSEKEDEELKNALIEITKTLDGNMSQALTKLRGLINEKAIRNFGKAKKREVAEEFEVQDLDKEIAKVREYLPQLSREDAIKLVDTLIHFEDGDAYGTYKNGIITLSRIAARGTLYHESFHYVADKLLSPEEWLQMFDAAREKWGDKNIIDLEELLAEDFRVYMQNQESFVGRLKNIWHRLWNFVTGVSSNIRYLDSLYSSIAQGKYKNIKSNSSNTRGARYSREKYTQEMIDILNKAPRDKDGNLLAPNGKVSKLTERQYAQVRTKAFKQWFGDWEHSIGGMVQDKQSYYRGTIEEPIIDKNGNLVLKGKTDSLYAKIGHSKEGVSLSNGDIQLAIEYGLGQIESASDLVSETYDADSELERISNEGYYLIRINKEAVSNKIIHNGEEVKAVGDVIIPRGSYIVEHIYNDGENSEISGSWNIEGVSKVVDENGEPLVVYHTNSRGSVTGPITTFSRDNKRYGDKYLYYFSSDEVTAKSYEMFPIDRDWVYDRNLSTKDLKQVLGINSTLAKHISKLKSFEEILTYLKRELENRKSIKNNSKSKFKPLGKIDLNTGERTDFQDNTKPRFDLEIQGYVYPDGTITYEEPLELVSDSYYEDAIKLIEEHINFINSNAKNSAEYKTNAVFLNLRTPKEFNAKGKNWSDYGKYFQRLGRYQDVEDYYNSNETNNNDGFIVSNYMDMSYEKDERNILSTTYAVVNSNQIKSATDNVGTFSSENDDIRYRRVKENSKKEALREDMQRFLDNFDIKIQDVEEFGGEVKLFDALNRTINIRNADNITDGVGEAIAFMMQYDPKIREIISVLKTGSKSALVKYNFHKPFRLEISNYLYKYKTDKQKYLGYLGREISNELKKLYNQEPISDKNKTLWEIIVDFFRKLNPITRYKINSIHNVISPIVNRIKNNDTSLIVDNYTRPGETKEANRLNVEQAFKDNPYEADIIKYLGDNGIVLAGSTSIALAGSLYRIDENPLHDIDFSAIGKNKEEIESLLDKKFKAFKQTNTIKDKGHDRTTYTYLVLDRPFVEKREMSNIAIMTIYDAKTGEKLGTRVGSNLILNKGVQGKMLDFFVGEDSFGNNFPNSTYNINGIEYKIADYRGAMEAKVTWQREKDIWDYNRFKLNKHTIEDIRNHNIEKLESYNLTKDQLEKIQKKGLSIEEYNDMTFEEKEVFTKCLF